MPDREDLIAQLAAHPAWSALREWAHEQRDLYLRNLAATIFQNPDIVTEQALREKAAYFRGMNRVLNQPLFDAKALKRDFENEVTDE